MDDLSNYHRPAELASGGWVFRSRELYDFHKAKRGAGIPQMRKSRISIYLDDRVIAEFSKRADAAGRGYQTMINDALREYIGKSARPLARVAAELTLSTQPETGNGPPCAATG